MRANRRPAAGAPRDRMLTGKMAGLVAGIALVAASLAWWLSPAQEGVRPPITPGTGGLWIRAGACDEDVWESDTGRKSELVISPVSPTPTTVGDVTALEDSREGPGWMAPWALRRPGPHHVTVVESRTVDGTIWLRAVNVLSHLPEHSWCPPDLAGDWDLVPSAPGAPARLRLHADGTLVLNSDGEPESGTWRASGSDLFIERERRSHRIAHLRLSPDRTRIEPGTTLDWRVVRRK